MTFCAEVATEAAAPAALPHGEEMMSDQIDAELAGAGAQHGDAEVMCLDDVKAFWSRLMKRAA